MVEKISTTSENTGNKNLEKLRKIFPQFVKDGVVDFDALKTFFDTEGISTEEEKYGLSWAGKSNAFRLIRETAKGTLVPQENESKDWDKTENIFIEGDNLEALKLLQKKYREQIKMIYIDPPYNTGHDFVYKDNFTESVADYYERTGQTEGGIKMTANTEKNGRFHSDWLTMMYPRLFLAKNLLRDDGVIFISIDDNEVANLRLIMDEIFGEENFVGGLIHQRAKGGGQAKQIVKGHDYILVYAKNIEGVVLRREKVVQQNIVEKDGKEYIRNDDILRKTFGKYDKSLGDRRCFYEEIEQYKGIEKKNEIDEKVKNGELFLEENGDGKHVIVEYVLLDEASSKLYSIIKVLSEEGKKDLEELGINEFDYPKPKDLVKQLVQSVTLRSRDENDIILDFFAGSGTTAHAVMDLNAEDGGNRKWICVQLPETTDEKSEAYKAGYKTIADISRERIRRVGEKILSSCHSREGGNPEALDLGFKSFVLQRSNYRQWNVLTENDDPEKLLAQSKLFLEHPLVDSYDERAVVYEILVKEGFDLNSSVIASEARQSSETEISPILAVTDGEKKLVVTFADKVSKEQVESLSLKPEDTFVCLDSALDDTTKVNIAKDVNLKVI